jgi:hypothetical protein
MDTAERLLWSLLALIAALAAAAEIYCLVNIALLLLHR